MNRRVVECAALISVFLSLISCGKKSSSENQTFKVIQETFENNIDVSGNIEAADQQKITAASDGTIEEVFFKEGDVIKKGQTLCTMDDLEQQYDLANLEYQIAQKQLNAAPREIQLLQMQLKVKKKALENKKSIARFDGVIAKLRVSKGDYLEATNEIATIIDRSYLKALVEVAETDASKLALNQKVVLKFPAYPEPVEGYVSYFPAVGKITSRGSTVVEAEIRVDNPPDEILTGYSFTGTIQITAPVSYLLVDKRCLIMEDGKFYANKQQKDGSFKKVEIECDFYGRDKLKVTAGLEEGDVVQNVMADLKSGSLKKELKGTDKPANKNQGLNSIMGMPGAPRR